MYCTCTVQCTRVGMYMYSFYTLLQISFFAFLVPYSNVHCFEITERNYFL